MKTTSTREVGGHLRDARRRAGLSQREVALAAGVQRPWLVQLEAGRGNPTLSSLFSVLKVLGLTLDLTEDQPTATPPPDEIRPPVDLDQLLARFRGDR
jgi:transcriptional regulator with XRE-family HTH domain